ncbi:MAG: DUF3850 domain-containing protein [Lachnospiraceae bacterium]|nr:DUF3850 domain-containing protein [Lachnospiraceae bacterium]
MSQKIHDLKILKHYATPVLEGIKTFEVRKDDRGYKKNDILRFHVTQPNGDPVPDHRLNGRQYLITYILDMSQLGIEEYVVLGIKPFQDTPDHVGEIMMRMCNEYCKYPDTWDEEEKGCELSDSGICDNCPMNDL